MRRLRATSIKVSLAIIGVGLLAIGLIFPYYAFHWGIKPCQGLPSDAANCGDGDFGGVLLLFSGGALVLYGLAVLILALLLKKLLPNFKEGRYLAGVYIGLTIVVALLAINFFA